jgi:hypothetical protein
LEPRVAAVQKTLVAVGTEARLNKVQATKFAQLASAGVTRTLNPPWTILGLAMMGSRDAESPGSIPVFADRRRRLDGFKRIQFSEHTTFGRQP